MARQISPPSTSSQRQPSTANTRTSSAAKASGRNSEFIVFALFVLSPWLNRSWTLMFEPLRPLYQDRKTDQTAAAAASSASVVPTRRRETCIIILLVPPWLRGLVGRPV